MYPTLVRSGTIKLPNRLYYFLVESPCAGIDQTPLSTKFGVIDSCSICWGAVQHRCPTPHSTSGGSSKGALPGTACSVPGKGAEPRGRMVFQHFAGVPSREFFRVPCLRFIFTGSVFFRGWYIIIPPGYFFVSSKDVQQHG